MRDPSGLRGALVVGAVGGALLTLASLAGVVRVPPVARPSDPVEIAARVNGVPIPAAAARALQQGIEEERREAGPPGAALETAVLDGLIDEELLFQRAEAIGITRADHMVRKRAIAALVDAVVREAEAGELTESDLEHCFAAHRARFAAPERVRVAVRPEPATAPLPDVPLGRRELAERVGPSVADAAFALAVGATSDPIEGPGGPYVITVLERTSPAKPRMAELRDETRALCRRLAGEDALDRYLAALRADARIERVAPAAPRG